MIERRGQASRARRRRSCSTGVRMELKIKSSKRNIKKIPCSPVIFRTVPKFLVGRRQCWLIASWETKKLTFGLK
jgi:hypothetical protein